MFFSKNENFKGDKQTPQVIECLFVLFYVKNGQAIDMHL